MLLLSGIVNKNTNSDVPKEFWNISYKSVQCSPSVMSDSLWPHGLQHARLPCPSPIPRAYSDSCPLSCWCHPTISSSVVPFSSLLQSFLASEFSPVSQFFTSGGLSIRASALASVFPMNIQDWFPLGWTNWISLQSKGLLITYMWDINHIYMYFKSILHYFLVGLCFYNTYIL